jgi:hypothetical protein
MKAVADLKVQSRKQIGNGDSRKSKSGSPSHINALIAYRLRFVWRSILVFGREGVCVKVRRANWYGSKDRVSMDVRVALNAVGCSFLLARRSVGH